jgi:co-chaperonin GroES (HSP10)
VFSYKGFLPLADRVVVRPHPLPERIGLIYVPDSAKERMKHELRRGTVLAMGPGMPTVVGKRWPMPSDDGVLPGATILYYPEAGQKITIAGEELISLRDDFVLCEDMAAERSPKDLPHIRMLEKVDEFEHDGRRFFDVGHGG